MYRYKYHDHRLQFGLFDVCQTPSRGETDQVFNEGKIKLAIKGGVKSIEGMKWAMNGVREKEKDTMDRRFFCSKRYVSTREKRWVIRDLEDCYWGRQFIPAARRYRKAGLRLVNGRVKTGKWMWHAERWSAGMYCGIIHHVLCCTITSCLSASEIRGVVQPSQSVCRFFYECSLTFNTAWCYK